MYSIRSSGIYRWKQHHHSTCYYISMVRAFNFFLLHSDRTDLPGYLLFVHRVHTFKIRVYPPAILPMLAVYSQFPLKHLRSFMMAKLIHPVLSVVSLAMEAIGDITASAEVSRVPVDGEEFDTRIQGGVLVRFSSYSSYALLQILITLLRI